MTAILGISAFYHDSAACVVVDGRIVAAAQEERFTRRKHDDRFPTHAVAYCLGQAGLSADRLDFVTFYDKPLLKFERLLETYLAYAPRGFTSFRTAMPVWLREKLFLSRSLGRQLRGYRRQFVYTQHHEAHAASAFFPSPFESAAILTLDGVGEWATATCGVGSGNRITLNQQMRFPHSLGLLYSAFTYFTGFKVNSGEYKLMGLAPYGEPRYVDRIMGHLIDLKEDGSFRMDMSYFNYCEGLTMTSPRFAALFDGPPRTPESAITRREMDLAASIQAVTEEIMLRCGRHVHRLTGERRLCLAGGVALNCVANGRLLREGPFEEIWVQPAAGDAGGALGAALFTWHQLLGNPRTPAQPDAQQGSLLGPAFQDGAIREYLHSIDVPYSWAETDDDLCDLVASLLDEGCVVGWFQERMEFGPRALGARSILGDPRSPAMQSLMNLKIKFRESFRPFAPAVLRERVAEYFGMRPDEDSPYMLLVAPVRQERRVPFVDGHRSGLDRVNEVRSQLPAITHVDFSARVQTVDPVRHRLFHKLLTAFEARTGCPVLINTSFNVRGEPIVCTPEDAYRCFAATNIDVLVLGRAVVRKSSDRSAAPHDVERYLAAFALD